MLYVQHRQRNGNVNYYCAWVYLTILYTLEIQDVYKRQQYIQGVPGGEGNNLRNGSIV